MTTLDVFDAHFLFLLLTFFLIQGFDVFSRCDGVLDGRLLFI